MSILEAKRGVYCPPFFDSQIQTQRFELQRGLINPQNLLDYKQDPVTNTRDWYQLHTSFENFVNAINGPRLDYLISINTKTNTYSPPGKYHVEAENAGFIHMDGNFYFTLFSQGILRSSPLAITSFVFGSYMKNGWGVEGEIKEELPVIVQLQARQDIVSRLLKRPFSKGLRWEFLLISLVELWSRSTGFKGMYLMPAEFNEYEQVRESERGRLRYDKTAERYGFKKDEESGLFLLIFE